MKTYKMKRVVVGIVLVMLTLGFCVLGTGAASADQMGGPGGQMGQGGPMIDRGFGRGGQGGPTDGQSFDGETPPEMPEGDFAHDGASFPGGFSPDGESASNGQFSRDGGFGPGGQRDFGSHGGFGHDGGPHGMDSDVLKAIDALEDGETKTNLETLMDSVHTAMEALHDADDDSREAAETAVNEARDALHEALKAAGIDVSISDAPEKPEIDSGTRPGLPENGRQNIPAFLNRENLENIDLDNEEQVQTLFQQFVSWLKGSNT
ncbi:MAG: hypothetical protein IKM82_03360 [Oscillospiraceae bacterium]|nr:hypothetical protein [Oscillospiraceae bacterium]MBR7073681.1 hypothetical protein [Oscillospiraceae bacterium]